jgi:thioredoxin 1
MKKLALILFAAFALVSQAMALDKEPFSEARFAQLQSEGKVVLVDVYADWCPTCKKQQAALQAYRDANPDKVFHILEVDFDNDKAQVSALRAPRQSTLLLFKGGKQFWFSVAETRPEVIAAELNKAFAAK